MLLDARDGLARERQRITRQPLIIRLPLAITLGILHLLLGLTIYVFSLPIYITRSPQTKFPLYARRRGDTYIDSYNRFRQTAQFTLALIAVIVAAVILGVISATLVRSWASP